MGLRLFSDSGDEPARGNPNPYNFEILEVTPIGDNAKIVLARYPECTTYGGLKLLLYTGWSERQIRSTTVLDPHFLEGSTTYPIPIARFRPNDMGRNLAVTAARALNKAWNGKTR